MSRMNNGSPYWNWVKQNGGAEPRENNPDHLVDPTSVPPLASTHKGQSFTAWLAYGFDRLTDRQKEVFDLSFRKQLSDVEVARRLGVIPRRVKQIKARLKEIIAESVEGVK